MILCVKSFSFKILLVFSYFFFISQIYPDEKGIIFKKIPEEDGFGTTKSINDNTPLKRWAIVIGVNNYEDSAISDLKYARNDAIAISYHLKRNADFENIFIFTDDNNPKSLYYPSYDNINAKFELLRKQIKPDDMVLIYYSGHGMSDETGASYLFTANTNINSPFTTSVSLKSIEDWLEYTGVKNNFIILDACRNKLTNTKSPVNTNSLNITGISDSINQSSHFSAIFFSTSVGEYSYEHDEKPYGVFTFYLSEGLSGKADINNDRVVSFNEMRAYTEAGVCKWAMDKNRSQKPFTVIKGEFSGDPPIVTNKTSKGATSFNPYDPRYNMRSKSILVSSLRYASLSMVIVGTTTAAVGGGVFANGVYGYNNLSYSNKTHEWDLYRNLSTSGIYTMIAGGFTALSFSIPFACSYLFDVNTGNKNLSLNIGEDYNHVRVSLSYKF